MGYFNRLLLDLWSNTFAAPGKRTYGTAARDFLIAGPRWNGTAPPPFVQGSGASRARQAYKLVDAATSQQLYLREWVLRAAPLSQPDDPSQRFYLLPVC